MHCPFCNSADTKVTDSRLVAGGNQVRRRRECLSCQERYTTYEKAELVLPQVIKRAGHREAFNEEKLRRGVERALEKRPIPSDRITAIIHDIKQRLRSSGEREISSKVIGEWIMAELRKIDQVAFVRFASVYRSFQDINEFNREIAKLQQENTNPASPPTNTKPVVEEQES